MKKERELTWSERSKIIDDWLLFQERKEEECILELAQKYKRHHDTIRLVIDEGNQELEFLEL